MGTLFFVGILVVCIIVIGGFAGIIVLNVAGLPGALVALSSHRSSAQFSVGIIVAMLGQSYVYLAYAAFVIGSAGQLISDGRVLAFVAWPASFLAVCVPSWFMLIRAAGEAKQSGVPANVQVEALNGTFLLAVIGFFVLAFVPSVRTTAWGWVPLLGG